MDTDSEVRTTVAGAVRGVAIVVDGQHLGGPRAYPLAVLGLVRDIAVPEAPGIAAIAPMSIAMSPTYDRPLRVLAGVQPVALAARQLTDVRSTGDASVVADPLS